MIKQSHQQVIGQSRQSGSNEKLHTGPLARCHRYSLPIPLTLNTILPIQSMQSKTLSSLFTPTKDLIAPPIPNNSRPLPSIPTKTLQALPTRRSSPQTRKYRSQNLLRTSSHHRSITLPPRNRPTSPPLPYHPIPKKTPFSPLSLRP